MPAKTEEPNGQRIARQACANRYHDWHAAQSVPPKPGMETT